MEQRDMALPGPALEDVDALRDAVERVLDDHWVPEGYAAPHAGTYPWQWLWDSCFHVLVWQALGRTNRAQVELASLFGPQAPSGFVPHMNYVRRPGLHADLWGRDDASAVTQPPMYGHAVAELVRAGAPPPDEVVEAAVAGLGFLLERRERDDSGLVLLCHPWESGADDSPRWDDRCPGGFDVERWRAEKNRLVTTIEFADDGSPVRNPAFPVASAGFNALVAFNARELASVVGDDGLAVAADELVAALDARWDDDLGTWADAGPTAGGSGRCRTADGLLPLLVTEESARAARVVADLVDPAAHGGPAGPTGVHRAEPTFDPAGYWRGPVWPQLAYLLVLGAVRFDPGAAEQLAATTVAGAWASGLAEYWHPDTGEGLGATPQSWTGLALLLAERT
ncbi:MAG: hypothetical protein VX516_00600 [Actinomycetota bacterium]|nr:hypothetical protein [Actinomycetota bacterium]MEE3275410.1 hypothetical protein [Actinomycetota bacterium]